MKRKSRPSKKPQPSGKSNAGEARREQATTAATNRARLWLFRGLALTLVPLLLFALIEVVLRIGGYGYPTQFFRKTQIQGKTFFVENAEFGRRFFPPGMARIPAPFVLPAHKATNSYRIFVLGESAALGDPEPAFGLARYLDVLLRERYPGTQFEVVSAAVTAINSHALVPIARECATRESDLWIIYMGNNEVVGPFGAGTVLGAKTPPLWLIRSTLAIKRLRAGQLFDSLVTQFTRGRNSARSWQGMQMFLEAQTRPNEPDRQRSKEYFQRNLKEILELASDHGIKVVLSTVGSNLKDCPPFASLHRADLGENDRQKWDLLFKQGIQLGEATNWAGALESYRHAAEIDARHAELQYRLGRCYLALTNASQARESFEAARDLDALAFRADTPINAVIRAAADAFKPKGLAFVDAVGELAKASPDRISGSEFFFEHVHLNPEGNYLLARACAEQAARLLPAWVSKRDQGSWMSAEGCASNLCITAWDRHRVEQSVLQRERQPPFTLQLDHDARMRDHAARLAAHRGMRTQEAANQASELYRQTLARRPNDFYLQGNYAKFLEDTGDYAAAVQQWKRVEQLLPHHFGPPYYLGKALARAGKLPEAEAAFRKTLALRPDAVEVMDELGEVLLRLKRPAEALAFLEEALRMQPGDARLRLRQADMLGALNRREEAMESLRRAIELRPDYWEARYLLGVELAMKERLPEATEQFSEVVRLNPDYPLGHLNLGVALAKQNRFGEAIEQFRATLRLDPTNRLAREYLERLQGVNP